MFLSLAFTYDNLCVTLTKREHHDKNATNYVRGKEYREIITSEVMSEFYRQRQAHGMFLSQR